MKKRIYLTLELDSEDIEDYMFRDDNIKEDLEREINCCSNLYEIIEFKTEIINKLRG